MLHVVDPAVQYMYGGILQGKAEGVGSQGGCSRKDHAAVLFLSCIKSIQYFFFCGTVLKGHGLDQAAESILEVIPAQLMAIYPSRVTDTLFMHKGDTKRICRRIFFLVSRSSTRYD